MNEDDVLNQSHDRSFSQTEKLAERDLSWLPLTIEDIPNQIYKAHVRPLEQGEIRNAVADVFGIKRQQIDPIISDIRSANNEILALSDSLVVVLDGRAPGKSDGYLGDLIEATRVINPLKELGKELIIATPHPYLFDGNTDNISILEIPYGISGEPFYPWNPDLLEFISFALAKDNISAYFPLSGTMPLIAQLDSNGRIQNESTFTDLKHQINPDGKKEYISPKRWASKGYHQIHAIQANLHLIDENLTGWAAIPDAYLKPNSAARFTADQVIRRYKCFECPPNMTTLYLHLGVAVAPNKIRFKYYPEESWKHVIDQIHSNKFSIGRITLMKPTDPDQAISTGRVAQYAEDKGYPVSLIPMDEIAQQYDWNLGSFIAFLQTLGNNGGTIIGCDSMPAGHAGPATGNKSIVLGNHNFPPTFYCPDNNSFVILPVVRKEGENKFTSDINPFQVARAVEIMTQEMLNK